jgi:hypothetical protein
MRRSEALSAGHDEPNSDGLWAAERLPVWTALSELYLDTELQAADLRGIAGTLRASPYAKPEIERILREEVAPAFSSNLLSVAGEWTPWSKEHVRDIMKGALAHRRGGWRLRIAHRLSLLCAIIPPEWNEVADLLDQ